MEEENIYPFLGIKTIEDKNYVVFFYEKDMGVVVHADSGIEGIRLGLHGEFDENQFEYLDPELQVPLHND